MFVCADRESVAVLALSMANAMVASAPVPISADLRSHGAPHTRPPIFSVQRATAVSTGSEGR